MTLRVLSLASGTLWMKMGTLSPCLHRKWGQTADLPNLSRTTEQS